MTSPSYVPRLAVHLVSSAKAAEQHESERELERETISNRLREAYKMMCQPHNIIPYLGECGRTREERPLFTVDGTDLSNV